MARIQQPTFSSGEVSPSIYGRVDLARYYSALRTCRNWIVRQYGGVTNRPGTEFVCEVKDSTKAVRVIPFVFSSDQTYVIELGDGYMRFIRNGARLEPTTSDVSAWSNATAYVADDYVAYGGVVYCALQAGTNKQPDVEPTYWVAATVYEITAPWTAAEIDAVKYVQSADVMTLVHPNYQPRELRRYGDFDWTLTEFANENGPFLDTNATSTTIYASAETGSVTLYASAAVFTANMVGGLIRLDEKDLSNVAPWEPGKRLATGPSAYGLLRRSDGKTYLCVSSTSGTSQTGTVRPTHDSGVERDGDGNPVSGLADVGGVEWEYMHSGYGIVQITGYTSATQVTGTVLTRLPQTVVGGNVAGTTWTFNGDGATTVFSVTGALSGSSVDYTVTVGGTQLLPTQYTVNPTTDQITFSTAPAVGVNNVVVIELARNYTTDIWSLGAWSDEYGYPSCVAYYQDRLCFANNAEKPQTVWMSKTSDYTNFGTSTPTTDDDAISFTINSRQVNEIRDLVPLDSLILLTSDAEWRVTEGSDQVLTPDSVGVRAQSFNGAADLQAKVIGRSALYVQDRGALIRDLTYSFEVDGFQGVDRTLLADHLFQNYTITDLDFCRVPYHALFATRSDGTLLTFTYLPEQEVAGWGRHDTGDGDSFERLCVVPEGTQDTPYFVVQRTIGGSTKRYIERLAPRLFADIRDAFFVDSGLSFDGRNTGATTMTVTGGSTWAAGESVTVTASSSEFVSGDAGDWIVLDPDDGAYRVLVTGYTSGTIVSGELLDPLPAAWRSTATTSWGWARDTFSGLSHLEGKTVSILGDANEYPQETVASGAVTIEGHAVIVHIGLPITADVEGLDIVVPNGESIRDRAKAINKLSLIVQETRGMQVGSDEDHLYDQVARDTEGYNEPATAVTDVVEIPMDAAYRKSSRWFARQDKPLPATICGVIAHVDVGG